MLRAQRAPRDRGPEGEKGERKRIISEETGKILP